MSTLIAPSVLAADYTQLAQELDSVVQGGADWLHLDVMDGKYVPVITFGDMLVKAMDRMTDTFLDVHLMIEQPENHIQSFVDAGADLITVHVESTTHVHRTLQQIRSHGIQCGVTLNPGTPLDAIKPCLGWVDLVLIMSVSPGYGGQAFIPESIDRVAQVARWRDEMGLSFKIEIDGGVTDKNAADLVSAGCDVLVAGSYVFKAQDRAAAIASLRS